MKNKVKKKRGWNRFHFLGVVIVLYIILFFLNPKNTYDSFKASVDIFIKLIPVLVLVVFFMGLINFLLKPKILAKLL